MTDAAADAINRHYGRTDYSQRILDALKDSGADIDALTRDDLAMFEEFHIGGREATRSMAKLAKLTEGINLLDVGCGIGGPARTLAAEFGCRVTGLDLTEEFCRAAHMLTERVGLGNKVEFVQGSALELPFDKASFDVVWTQHAAMNIDDKELLYSEIHRVLRPNGTLALYDIMAGPKPDLRFPVLWATDASMSFLCPPDEIRLILETSDFTVIEWIDKTEQAIIFWQKRQAAMDADDASDKPLIRLIVGEKFAARATNSFRNLQEKRIVVAQSILKRN